MSLVTLGFVGWLLGLVFGLTLVRRPAEPQQNAEPRDQSDDSTDFEKEARSIRARFGDGGKMSGSEPNRLEIAYSGKTFAGSYVFEQGGVTVTSSWGQKFAIAHALTAETIAKIVLREILEEAKERGDI